MALDEIATDRWEPCERADVRLITAFREAATEVVEEARPRVLARAEKDRVRVRGGLPWQRGHMQPAERHVSALLPIVVGDAIRTMRRRDVDLNDDNVGLIVQVQSLDVLVLNLDLIAVAQIAG